MNPLYVTFNQLLLQNGFLHHIKINLFKISQATIERCLDSNIHTGNKLSLISYTVCVMIDIGNLFL